MADMSMLKKLMASKKPAGLDPEAKQVKMDLLKELHGQMGKEMGGELSGLKKVTVAAPDASSLKEGLEKAKEMMPAEGSEDEEASETPDMEASEDEKDEEKMSVEELDAKIKELEDLKKHKMMAGM